MDQTVISSLFGIGLLGTIFHSKFQARQSKNDITELKLEVKDFKKTHDLHISSLYTKIETYVRDVGIKIDSSNNRVIDKLDNIKSEFRSSDTCDELRHTCRMNDKD